MLYNNIDMYECKHHPGYYVTRDGRVFSSYVIGGRGKTDLCHIHELRYGHDKDGYLRVVLCLNGRRSYVKVHTLIVEQFIGDVIPPMVVNHIDGDKLNNHAENLEIVTVVNNTQHAHRHYLCPNDISVCVEMANNVVRFPSMAACAKEIPDLSIHYLQQLKNNKVQFSIVDFRKRYNAMRRSPIIAYYNGRPYKTFESMKDCDLYFGVAKGSTSAAISSSQYRRRVNKYHVTFPNVSTIESTVKSEKQVEYLCGETPYGEAQGYA